MTDQLQRAADGRPPTKGFSAWINGRARRRDYWAWCVPLLVVMILLEAPGIPGLTLIASVPMLMVWIRRFHDLGFTGWFAPLINVAVNVLTFLLGLLQLGDIALAIAFLLYMVTIVVLGSVPGQKTTNRFGPPKGKAGKLAETFS